MGGGVVVLSVSMTYGSGITRTKFCRLRDGNGGLATFLRPRSSPELSVPVVVVREGWSCARVDVLLLS